MLLIHIADVEPGRRRGSASAMSDSGAACKAHVLLRSRPTALAQLSLSVRVCDYQPMQPLTNTREKVDWRLKPSENGFCGYLSENEEICGGLRIARDSACRISRHIFAGFT